MRCVLLLLVLFALRADASEWNRCDSDALTSLNNTETELLNLFNIYKTEVCQDSGCSATMDNASLASEDFFDAAEAALYANGECCNCTAVEEFLSGQPTSGFASLDVVLAKTLRQEQCEVEQLCPETIAATIDSGLVADVWITAAVNCDYRDCPPGSGPVFFPGDELGCEPGFKSYTIENRESCCLDCSEISTGCPSDEEFQQAVSNMQFFSVSGDTRKCGLISDGRTWTNYMCSDRCDNTPLGTPSEDDIICTECCEITTHTITSCTACSGDWILGQCFLETCDCPEGTHAENLGDFINECAAIGGVDSFELNGELSPCNVDNAANPLLDADTCCQCGQLVANSLPGGNLYWNGTECVGCGDFFNPCPSEPCEPESYCSAETCLSCSVVAVEGGFNLTDPSECCQCGGYTNAEGKCVTFTSSGDVGKRAHIVVTEEECLAWIEANEWTDDTCVACGELVGLVGIATTRIGDGGEVIRCTFSRTSTVSCVDCCNPGYTPNEDECVSSCGGTPTFSGLDSEYKGCLIEACGTACEGSGCNPCPNGTYPDASNPTACKFPCSANSVDNCEKCGCVISGNNCTIIPKECGLLCSTNDPSICPSCRGCRLTSDKSGCESDQITFPGLKREAGSGYIVSRKRAPVCIDCCSQIPTTEEDCTTCGGSFEGGRCSIEACESCAKGTYPVQCADTCAGNNDQQCANCPDCTYSRFEGCIYIGDGGGGLCSITCDKNSIKNCRSCGCTVETDPSGTEKCVPLFSELRKRASACADCCLDPPTTADGCSICGGRFSSLTQTCDVSSVCGTDCPSGSFDPGADTPISSGQACTCSLKLNQNDCELCSNCEPQFFGGEFLNCIPASPCTDCCSNPGPTTPDQCTQCGGEWNGETCILDCGPSCEKGFFYQDTTCPECKGLNKTECDNCINCQSTKNRLGEHVCSNPVIGLKKREVAPQCFDCCGDSRPDTLDECNQCKGTWSINICSQNCDPSCETGFFSPDRTICNICDGLNEAECDKCSNCEATLDGNGSFTRCITNEPLEMNKRAPVQDCIDCCSDPGPVTFNECTQCGGAWNESACIQNCDTECASGFFLPDETTAAPTSSGVMCDSCEGLGETECGKCSNCQAIIDNEGTYTGCSLDCNDCSSLPFDDCRACNCLFCTKEPSPNKRAPVKGCLDCCLDTKPNSYNECFQCGGTWDGSTCFQDCGCETGFFSPITTAAPTSAGMICKSCAGKESLEACRECTNCNITVDINGSYTGCIPLNCNDCQSLSEADCNACGCPDCTRIKKREPVQECIECCSVPGPQTSEQCSQCAGFSTSDTTCYQPTCCRKGTYHNPDIWLVDGVCGSCSLQLYPSDCSSCEGCVWDNSITGCVEDKGTTTVAPVDFPCPEEPTNQTACESISGCNYIEFPLAVRYTCCHDEIFDCSAYKTPAQCNDCTNSTCSWDRGEGKCGVREFTRLRAATTDPPTASPMELCIDCCLTPPPTVFSCQACEGTWNGSACAVDCGPSCDPGFFSPDITNCGTCSGLTENQCGECPNCKGAYGGKGGGYIGCTDPSSGGGGGFKRAPVQECIDCCSDPGPITANECFQCGGTWNESTCTLDCGTTASPTASPTAQPTASPTAQPTVSPTAQPTASPTAQPTVSPTAQPTTSPTAQPTVSPTAQPTASPTAQPTASPTTSPTAQPTASPTKEFCLDGEYHETEGGCRGLCIPCFLPVQRWEDPDGTGRQKWNNKGVESVWPLADAYEECAQCGLSNEQCERNMHLNDRCEDGYYREVAPCWAFQHDEEDGTWYNHCQENDKNGKEGPKHDPDKHGRCFPCDSTVNPPDAPAELMQCFPDTCPRESRGGVLVQQTSGILPALFSSPQGVVVGLAQSSLFVMTLGMVLLMLFL